MQMIRNMLKMPVFCLTMALLIGLAVCQWCLPEREMSEMENRVLSKKPALTFSGFWSGDYATQLEKFSADQLPLRDAFVSVYATMQAGLGRRVVGDAMLGEDGFLFDTATELKARNVELNTRTLVELAELTGKEAYLLLVPAAATVYADKRPEGAAEAGEIAVIEQAAQRMTVIPLLEDMMDSGREDLYYAMDHHWTAAGARFGYEAVCETLGLTPVAEGTVVSWEGFYGSFYARYPLPWLQADVLTYEAVPGIRLVVNGEEKAGLVDEAALAGRDKYAALLYGNHGYMELINDGVEDGVLLVIKDSYANALLPVLAQHYHRIIAVDPRYFAGNIVELTNEYEGEVILCVCGTGTLAALKDIAVMEGF